MGQSKEPIRLRQRKTPADLISLYLDIYLNGQRSYEYLKLYLIPETNKEDKRRNQETLKLAEAIRAKRLVELQNSEYGFKSPFKVYLTDKEVADLLRVSRRTLQEYRNERLLPYIILGGKALYPESGLREVLEANYRKPFR